MRRQILGSLAIMFLCASLARADVKLPTIIGDNMVLQQGVKLNIWGTAAADEKVTVKIAGQSVSAAADTAGNWRVQLAPLAATGQPIEMTVAGNNTLTIKNILVGDVWLGSGQSNMQMNVNSCFNAKADVDAATFPTIRLFTVANRKAGEPQPDAGGRWVECSPATVGTFSAALFFFSREIHKAKPDLPLGLISSSWGGTRIEPWTSRQGYEACDAIKPLLVGFDQQMDAFKKTPPSTQPGKGNPVREQAPTCLYNAMIAPVTPFAIKGAVWYQGESNAGSPDRTALYAAQLPALIADWRKQWGIDFPFYIVQLANYRTRLPQPGDADWARLRESQAKTLAVPRTGLACIIDCGDGGDIHPKNKQEAGRRLALLALANDYSQKVVCSGPTFDAMKIEGNQVRITFKNAAGLAAKRMFNEKGLALPQPETMDKVIGFALAGEDKKFVWADAKIDGETVVLSAPGVSKPVAVRYGWANNPDVNLYNEASLPAVPFRTDNW